mmetsp:Transcript_28046/g.54947  ORF Transcript_28046/g.54947 Transcript_28046/m.54947 type:complete len:283 (-) Transcript_28046:462-1310(-)
MSASASSKGSRLGGDWSGACFVSFCIFTYPRNCVRNPDGVPRPYSFLVAQLLAPSTARVLSPCRVSTPSDRRQPLCLAHGVVEVFSDRGNAADVEGPTKPLAHRMQGKPGDIIQMRKVHKRLTRPRNLCPRHPTRQHPEGPPGAPETGEAKDGNLVGGRDREEGLLCLSQDFLVVRKGVSRLRVGLLCDHPAVGGVPVHARAGDVEDLGGVFLLCESGCDPLGCGCVSVSVSVLTTPAARCDCDEHTGIPFDHVLKGHVPLSSCLVPLPNISRDFHYRIYSS